MIQRLLFGVGFLSVVAAACLGGYVVLEYAEQQQKQNKWHVASSEKPAEPQIPQETYHYSRLDQWGELVIIKPPNHPLIDRQMSQAKPKPEPVVWKTQPKEGEKIGTLLIPSIDAQIPIWEGTREEQLDKGVGRHRSTGLPGQGRTVLAGHRETAFARAGQIKKGDKIVVDLDQGQLEYKVAKMWVTSENDLSVVVPSEKQQIVLYTCFPFKPGSSTEKRYIIEADLVR